MVDKERISPALANLSRQERLRLFCGLTGSRPERWLLFGDNQEIDNSLTNYARAANNAGFFSPFSLEYCFKSQCGWFTRGKSDFYLDAPRNFLLKRGEGNYSGQEVLAALSFLIVGVDKVESKRYPGLNIKSLWKNDVLVTQIQSQKEIDSASLLELKKAKWERNLLRSAVGWAQDVGLARVLVVPAENNYWLNNNYCQQGGDNLEKRFFLRYDVTARRCGFKQEEKNLPYVLELPNKTLFNAF